MHENEVLDCLQELTYNVTQIQIASFTVFGEKKKRPPTDEAAVMASSPFT